MKFLTRKGEKTQVKFSLLIRNAQLLLCSDCNTVKYFQKFKIGSPVFCAFMFLYSVSPPSPCIHQLCYMLKKINKSKRRLLIQSQGEEVCDLSLYSNLVHFASLAQWESTYKYLVSAHITFLVLHVTNMHCCYLL